MERGFRLFHGRKGGALGLEVAYDGLFCLFCLDKRSKGYGERIGNERRVCMRVCIITSYTRSVRSARHILSCRYTRPVNEAKNFTKELSCGGNEFLFLS